MRIRNFLVIGALALLFGPSTGLTQIGPPGGGGRQGGFGGGGQFDPNQLFNMMSGGKDVIVASEITDPGIKAMFDRTAQRMGISNGQITRQQFAENMQQRMAQRAAAPQRAAVPAVITLSGNPVAPGANPWAGNQFGGNPWGGNPWGGWGNPDDGMPLDDQEDEVKKPIVYKGNNLPRELDWFQQLDKDHDGQVGLYEWKASGMSIEEFQKRDLNGDGFITVEEILKYEAKNNPKPKTDQQTTLAQGNSGGRQGNFGQRGAGNFGQGGGGQRVGNFGQDTGGQPGNYGQGNGRRGNFGQGNPDPGAADRQPGGFQRNRSPDGQPAGGNGGGNRGGRGRGQRGGGGGGGFDPQGGANPQGDPNQQGEFDEQEEQNDGDE